MILVDRPYVSDFLKETLVNYRFQVVKTREAAELLEGLDINFISEEEAREAFKLQSEPALITTSENAINWISANLPSSKINRHTREFKNKVLFRQRLYDIYPDFFFKKINADDIPGLDISGFPLPFIIKPAVGFFSLSVYKVNSMQDWPEIKESILNDIRNIREIYPLDVLDTAQFIVEENIEGEEYAFDAYFDDEGQPVILCILKHIFGSEKDVSDRVYMTSDEIVRNKLKPFTDFLRSMGQVLDLKNFPLHVEVRVDENNILRPIEVNPLRYGAWCTSSDLTHMAFNFNSYQYYLENKKPDWDILLKDKEDKIFSIIILNNSTGKDVSEIRGFDYKKLLSNFEKPLELRPTDYRKYLIFGFLFAETGKDNFAEIEHILSSDLSEFIF